MVRRINVSQLRSQLNRIQSQQRQAISRYNQAVRNYNAAVNRYNSAARAHNAKVRSDRQRLQAELNRLAASTRTRSSHVTYRTSTTILHESFQRVEVASSQGLIHDASLLDHAESEAANGIAAYNALNEAPEYSDDDDPSLRQSTLADELLSLGGDLDQRWRGAVYALSPYNPDAARHFSSSAREILITMVDRSATDAEVLAADPAAHRTPQGSISRRARIQFCLKKRGENSPDLAAFVEDDVDNVLSLLGVLNSGTHGEAGQFDLRQLSAIKVRAEEAIRFVARIAYA